MNEITLAANNATRGAPPVIGPRTPASNEVIVGVSDTAPHKSTKQNLHVIQGQSKQIAEETEADPEKIAQAVNGVNDLLSSNNANHIKFSMHEETNRIMVQVIDEATQEVIKTIPSEELLDLAATIGDLVGTLIDERT